MHLKSYMICSLLFPPLMQFYGKGWREKNSYVDISVCPEYRYLARSVTYSLILARAVQWDCVICVHQNQGRLV